MHKVDVRIAPFLLCAAALCACGGGGGGSSSSGTTVAPVVPGASATATPTPAAKATATPTGTPVTLPSASAASPSQVAVNSNPVGLTVTVDGTVAGVTPLTPTIGYGAHTVTITPKTTASPYAVAVANTGNGGITLFYNQTSDSNGKIGSGIATSAVARAQTPARVAAGTLQRSAQSFADRPAYATDKISVEYDAAGFGTARTFAAVEAAHGVARAQTLAQGAHVTRVLTLAPGRDADATLGAMRAETGVIGASRIGLRYPAASSTGPVYPNDTYFKAANNGANADQWYLYLIDAEDAWGYGQGKASIAVIDTGSDPLQTEVAGLVTFSETIVNLESYAGAVDTDGHGTFLSSIADAQTNNGAGFAGAADNAPLQEYKIFASGSTSAQTSDEAAAIRAAVANNAKVILLALQSSPANGPDPLERDAVAFAIANGVTVVAASGDDSGTALDYPAAYPGVISVGASIVNDSGTPGTVTGQGNSEQVASYSNYGTGLSLVAPGGQGTGSDADLLHWIEGSYTTQPASGTPACAPGTAPPDCKILFTGTSPAAALVAGTASLMLTVNGALTPAQIAQMLVATTDDIKDAKEGHGRLNAQRAVALAAGDPNAQPALPLPRAIQFVAIAYTNSGATLPVAPAIINTSYPKGVPVNADGTFRIADVSPASLGTGVTAYKIGIWLSLAGDGKVHTGDYFATATCSISAACTTIGSLTAAKITGTTLP
jgi:hypothetical protein